jgi:hypothetical protein
MKKMMKSLFEFNDNSVIKIFEILQKSTRQLQTLCAHSKAEKDKQLSNEVPLIKKSLGI